jgi:hypothetical protein
MYTVDHARSLASSNSAEVFSSGAAPIKVSTSSALTPLDSRKATFFSRGASRIEASSRNREACSSKFLLSGASRSLSVGVGASTAGAVLCSDCSSGCDCEFGSIAVDEAPSADPRCHEGMLGLFAMFLNTFIFWATSTVCDRGAIKSAWFGVNDDRRMAGPRHETAKRFACSDLVPYLESFHFVNHTVEDSKHLSILFNKEVLAPL